MDVLTRGARAVAWILSCATPVCACSVLTALDEGLLEGDSGVHGACETECESGQVCSQGACAEDCGLLETCDGICVDVRSDRGHCGSCGVPCPSGSECCNGTCLACGAGEVCAGDACGCAAGTTDCDPEGALDCVDTLTNVDHCGECGRSCREAEYCEAGVCVCRPGLEDCSGDDHLECIDTSATKDDCGACDFHCEDKCEDATCVEHCSADREDCGGGCVDVDTDPRNCGRCDERCHVDEVCVSGHCRRFDDSRGCAACPCPACVDISSTCCTYPGATHLVCVSGPSCP